MRKLYTEKELKLSDKLLEIHSINKKVKLREFCEKWGLDYFQIQIRFIKPKIANVFLSLRQKYPQGKIVIFYFHCKFDKYLALRGLLGFYIPDKYDPKIVLVDISGAKQSICHSRIGVDINSPLATCGYEEF